MKFLLRSLTSIMEFFQSCIQFPSPKTYITWYTTCICLQRKGSQYCANALRECRASRYALSRSYHHDQKPLTARDRT